MSMGMNIDKAAALAEYLINAQESFKEWIGQDEHHLENVGMALAETLGDALNAAVKMRKACPPDTLTEAEHQSVQQLADVSSAISVGLKMLDGIIDKKVQRQVPNVFAAALGIVLAAKHLTGGTEQDVETMSGAVDLAVKNIISDMVRSGATKQ